MVSLLSGLSSDCYTAFMPISLPLYRVHYRAEEPQFIRRWRPNNYNIFVALLVQNPAVAKRVVNFVSQDSDSSDIRSLRFSTIWLDGVELTIPSKLQKLREAEESPDGSR